MEVVSRLELEQFQLSQLRAQLPLIARHNPFYRKRWETAGIDPDVRSLDDFRERFPFTTKQELVADQSENPPYGSNLTFPLERYTRCHGTSGSTGRPLRWLDTPESWNWMLGNWRRVYAAAGVTPEDRIFYAFSFGPFLGFWTAFESALQLGCLCLPGGGLTSVARIRSLLEQRATVLCCTPTYALHLGDVARQENLDLSASAIRRVIVAGEPGGSVPTTRSAIEVAWPGARVFDHHGMTEVGPVSYECPASSGRLHIIESSYITEVVDPATGLPVAAETAGELVLTPLGRAGSPLVRYRTGDLVQARTSAEPCVCGSTDVALEGGVLGRTDDMVVVRGVNVYPSAIEAVIRDVGGVAEYQVEVMAAGSLLELHLRVEPEPARVDARALKLALEEALRTRLALRVPVSVVEMGTLPRFEMKARRWVRTTSPIATSPVETHGASGT